MRTAYSALLSLPVADVEIITLNCPQTVEFTNLFFFFFFFFYIFLFFFFFLFFGFLFFSVCLFCYFLFCFGWVENPYSSHLCSHRTAIKRSVVSFRSFCCCCCCFASVDDSFASAPAVAQNEKKEKIKRKKKQPKNKTEKIESPTRMKSRK